jgi:sulfide:quinone oxidoreductase
MADVVIAGAGFGGLAAAHELKRLLPEGDTVTVVDRNDRFFMGFAKLWDLGGVRPLSGGTAPLAGLERHGIRFVQAEVQTLDPAARTVETTAGTLTGDALLVALGAGPAVAHTRMLDGPRAHDLYDAAALPAMHAALDAITSGRIVVPLLGGPFKCPPAPYEAALIVDERLRSRGVRDSVEIVVTTFQPLTVPAAGPDASRYVAGHLEGQGIGLRTATKVTGIDHDTSVVRFDGGDELGFDLLLGVPANEAPPALAGSGLLAPSGWIEPDRHTLATTAERVYAVGDCTLVPTASAQLPKAGVFAAAEGQVAAANIAADLHGGDRARFDGHGYCFLELPGRKVALVEGDFFAEPAPDVHLTDADEEHFARKQAFERERLAAWLGGD